MKPMRWMVQSPMLVLGWATAVTALGAEPAPRQLADLRAVAGETGQTLALADNGTAHWQKEHPFGDTVGNLLTIVPAKEGGWWCRRITPGPDTPIDLSWHRWNEGDDVTEALKATARWYPRGLYLKAPGNVSTLVCDSLYFGFAGVFEHSIATPQAPGVGQAWRLDGWWIARHPPAESAEPERAVRQSPKQAPPRKRMQVAG